ncbi:hypothetical protein AMECASPLE_039631 [Ameca splendens]|uniref:Secreted protein n=1 Tax=Ameca splendens TaxID=208324 RepID=A0ABV0XXJ0_9TELE
MVSQGCLRISSRYLMAVRLPLASTWRTMRPSKEMPPVKEVVCVFPCDGLAICPGCTLPLAHRLLEIGTSSPVTHYGISGGK